MFDRITGLLLLVIISVAAQQDTNTIIGLQPSDSSLLLAQKDKSQSDSIKNVEKDRRKLTVILAISTVGILLTIGIVTLANYSHNQPHSLWLWE
jgi:hypothetical protein